MDASIHKELESLSKQVKAAGGGDIRPCRSGHSEYALPHTEQEYVDLCGRALLRLEVNSDVRNELPLKKVYFRMSDGKEHLLQRIGLGDQYDRKVFDKSSDPGNVYFKQISFWFFPIWFLTDDGSILMADFNEERTEFALQRGPWKTDDRIMRLLTKHANNQLNIGKTLNEDFLAVFLSREFPGRLGVEE